mmetsp:Transcript_16387/g.33736  ORF Transcript_16387/g.33736 Transcript_16387/m.33736 type:complete len:329 (+) Transcript_16387:119-1105(+)
MSAEVVPVTGSGLIPTIQNDEVEEIDIKEITISDTLNHLPWTRFVQLAKGLMASSEVKKTIEEHSSHIDHATHDPDKKECETHLAVHKYLVTTFPKNFSTNSLEGNPVPFVRRFLWRFYEILPERIKEASEHPPTRILPPQIFVPLFRFLVTNINVRWWCFQQTHFASLYINWRFTATEIVDYPNSDHQKFSTLAFFPVASLEPDQVLSWLQNLRGDNAIFKHYKIGSFFHSKFVGGARKKDRIRVCPPSRVNKYAGVELEHVFKKIVFKYRAFRQVKVGTKMRMDANGNMHEVEIREGEYYKRIMEAVERIQKDLRARDGNRSVLMC